MSQFFIIGYWLMFIFNYLKRSCFTTKLLPIFNDLFLSNNGYFIFT